MSADPCDVVAERIALGEPLGDLADHAASCPACRRIAALPTELGALRREPEPALGFSARMTAGAQQRIGVRRRRRIAAAAIAATAATVMMTLALTRHGDTPNPKTAQPAADTSQHKDPWETGKPAPGNVDDDERALVRLADTDRALHYRANWRAIEKPLAPYSKLVKGVEP
jgi:hypothetical protein